MCPKCFLKISGNPNNYQFYLLNFLKFFDNISHKLWRSNQFLEIFLEILHWPTLPKKIRPLALLSTAVYWQSSNAKACDKKLSKILAKNTDNGGMGIGLKIYVRYCRCLPDFTAIDVAFANIFKSSKVSVEGVKKQPLSELLLGRVQSRKYFHKFSDRNLLFKTELGILSW